MKKISLTIPSVGEGESELTLSYVDEVFPPQDVLSLNVLKLTIKDKNSDETTIEINLENLENSVDAIRAFYPWTT